MAPLAQLLRPAAAPIRVRLARRFGVLRRDLGALARGLAGRHAAPLVARSAAAAAGRPAPASAGLDRRGATAAARELVVAEVRRETPDAVTLVLADPAGAPIPFRPGQFFTLLVDAGGETLRRAYSACSSHLDPSRVAVTVKRVAGGRVSNHLNDRARAGDLVRILGPSGDFGLAPDPARARHVVLVGGGSGITPLMAILRGVLAVEPASRVTLVYGNRRAADVVFAAELGALAEADPRLVVRHVLEEPDPRAAAVGRLDEATFAAVLDEALAAAPAAPAARAFYVCGPEPMMAAVRATLVVRGVAPADVHEERFASLRPAAPHGPQLATIRVGGRDHAVPVAAGATLLDAGLDAGLDLPFSCAMGGCGACAVELRAGAVDLDEPNCLDPDERARGRILACVARPLGPCTIEVAS